MIKYLYFIWLFSIHMYFNCDINGLKCKTINKDFKNTIKILTLAFSPYIFLLISNKKLYSALYIFKLMYESLEVSRDFLFPYRNIAYLWLSVQYPASTFNLYKIGFYKSFWKWSIWMALFSLWLFLIHSISTMFSIVLNSKPLIKISKIQSKFYQRFLLLTPFPHKPNENLSAPEYLNI